MDILVLLLSLLWSSALLTACICVLLRRLGR